uniref:Uncharacterized protein n=1 Tax=Aegilops tauschii TaxID=37682 RepID=M8CER3_AEGTA
MADDAAAHDPDGFNKWWETFNNGGAVEDEPMVDSDSDFEQGAEEEEEDAGVVAGGRGPEGGPPPPRPGGRAAAAPPAIATIAANDHPLLFRFPRRSLVELGVAEEEISEDGHFQLEGVLQGMKREAAAGRNTPGATAAEIQNEVGQEEYVSEDTYVGVAEEISEDSHFQREDGLLGRNREAAAKLNTPRASGDEVQNEEDQEWYVSEDKIGGGQQARKRKTTVAPNKQQMTGIKIRKKTVYGECLRAENQMLRLQLVRKTKELEAEQIRRLELELHFMKKENELLKKQLEELKAENEYYKKTAKPQKTRRLCRFCKEYVDHDYRNCPERRASACSEEDDGSN